MKIIVVLEFNTNEYLEHSLFMITTKNKCNVLTYVNEKRKTMCKKCEILK